MGSDFGMFAPLLYISTAGRAMSKRCELYPALEWEAVQKALGEGEGGI